ncbi:MAG: hypothetical protein AB8G99_02900, partial [Planctomycetaceae bacterium]
MRNCHTLVLPELPLLSEKRDSFIVDQPASQLENDSQRVLRMKYVLTISGVLAGLSLAFPELVLWGYFLLIVPGVILTIAPTVFVYCAGTAIFREIRLIDSALGATALGFVLTLGLGWLVMQPFRGSALKAYHTQCLPDVSSDRLIELNGRVRIEMPDHRGSPSC